MPRQSQCMRKLEAEQKPSKTTEPIEDSGFSAVREQIQAHPAGFIRALGERLFLVGTDVQLFSDPHARADLLGVDRQGTAVVVVVEREGEHSLLERGLMCAGLVAGWKSDYFFRYPSPRPVSRLRRLLTVPEAEVNKTQRVVLVARSHDYAIYGAAQWLAQRHGIEISCVLGGIDAASGRLTLTRVGPESFDEQGPAETVRIVHPKPSGQRDQGSREAEPGLPRQPATDPLTTAVTEVCRVQTIWRPDSDKASPSIEKRLRQIIDEERRQARREEPAADAPTADAGPIPAPAPAPAAPPASRPAPPTVAAPAVEVTKPTPGAGAPARATLQAPKVAVKPQPTRPWLPRILGGLAVTAALVVAGVLIVGVRGPRPEVRLEPRTQLPPAPPPPFEGVVRDASTHHPIPGARLYYAGQSLRAGPSGEFQLDLVEDDRKVLVKAPGYRQAEVTLDSSGPITLQPFEVRGYYVSHSHVADPFRREDILKLIRGTSANAAVLGVKDVTGRLNVGVNHPIAREIRSANRAGDIHLARQVAAWKAEGIYTIALLTVFKDDLLARTKPDLALRGIQSGRAVIDADGIAWADPAAPLVQEYNVEVAKAAAEAGFDEVQFDFIRYPSQGLSLEGASQAEYQRRLRTVVAFLRNASEALAPYNVYLSASVFGSVCVIPRASVIGQKIEEFGEHVDYVSPMLYPSYFEPGRRYPAPLRNSYQLVYDNLMKASLRLEGNGRRLRPWLQNFPDNASPSRPLEAESIRHQVQGAEDANASGWMLWDARNRYHNTLEAISLLNSDRGRAQARDDVSGGNLLPVVFAVEGEPPPGSRGAQFGLVGALVLAGCCLALLYAAVRAAWLFRQWNLSHPRPRVQTETTAAGSGRWITRPHFWGRLPQARTR